MLNQFEEAGRLRKMTTLLLFLLGQQCTAEMAEVATEDQKRDIAKRAGVKMPSEKTWAMVVDALRNASSRGADRREPDYEIQGKEW